MSNVLSTLSPVRTGLKQASR